MTDHADRPDCCADLDGPIVLRRITTVEVHRAECAALAELGSSVGDEPPC